MTLLPPNNDAYKDIFGEKLYAVNVDDKSFKAHLISEQDNDPVIGPAKKSVANGEVIKIERLKWVTNQLHIEDNLLVKSGRPVLPASLHRYLVSKFYETSYFGREKMYALIKEHFYFPNMYTYIKHFVSTCSVSERTKCDIQAPKAPFLPLLSRMPLCNLARALLT